MKIILFFSTLFLVLGVQTSAMATDQYGLLQKECSNKNHELYRKASDIYVKSTDTNVQFREYDKLAKEMGNICLKIRDLRPPNPDS